VLPPVAMLVGLPESVVVVAKLAPTSDANATAYWLDISAIGPGGNDVFQSGSLPSSPQQATVYSLPGTYPATEIYVTLYSLVSGQWVNNAYTYNSGPVVQ
jgi:hypothetical protein